MENEALALAHPVRRHLIDPACRRKPWWISPKSETGPEKPRETVGPFGLPVLWSRPADGHYSD